MMIVRNGMGVWLQEQLDGAQQMLEKFVAKLHDDDGNLVKADVASFAFEWAAGEIVTMAEAKVYASILASFNKAKEDGKSEDEWMDHISVHVTEQVINLASYTANKSSLPSAHLAKDGELQAWAKVAEALKWAKINRNEEE